ncbi:hypothetical protein O8B39_06385 [Agrobacterium rhizogenes]|nr:hypothetical protein [Rhizobium rhizogenes]
MNRRARRIAAKNGLEWAAVKPQGTYRELGDNDGRDLLMQVFKAVAGEACIEAFDDETLFNSTMSLIEHGFLKIWFAIDVDQIRVRFDMPQIQGSTA